MNKPVAKAAAATPTYEPRAPMPVDPPQAAAAAERSVPDADPDTARQAEAITESAPFVPREDRTEVLQPPTVAPAVMPEVVLSAAHAADCLLRVGDKFPAVRLPDLMAKMRSLSDLQGDSLTVIVFWSDDWLLAEDQLRYLDRHIARYRDLGIRAIAVNVGQTPDRVKKTVAQIDLATPVLLDIDRVLFSRVGANHLPRTYLIDHDGAVLWFDIEFSRHTRERLEQAIHASLQST